MKIRKQGGFTGFWVRVICRIERETIQSLSLLLDIILQANWHKTDNDPKVLVPSDLQSEGNNIIGSPSVELRMEPGLSRFGYNCFTRSSPLPRWLQILKDFSLPGYCGTGSYSRHILYFSCWILDSGLPSFLSSVFPPFLSLFFPTSSSPLPPPLLLFKTFLLTYSWFTMLILP